MRKKCHNGMYGFCKNCSNNGGKTADKDLSNCEIGPDFWFRICMKCKKLITEANANLCFRTQYSNT